LREKQGCKACDDKDCRPWQNPRVARMMEPSMIGVSHDERAQQQFVLALNKYVQSTLAEGSQRVCRKRCWSLACPRCATPPITASAPPRRGAVADIGDADAGPALAVHRRCSMRWW
jgi:hypothetical protein